MFSSMLLKRKAIKAMTGNWQTALLVTFFAGILVTAYSLVRIEVHIDISDLGWEAMLRSASNAVKGIPEGMLALYSALFLLSTVFTPALEMGCNHYFICRVRGEELGFKGLFSRMGLVGKGLLLSLYMGIKIMAWSLLFVIPGIMAAIRYSMAPYFMAENPALTVPQAVEKSKAAMKNNGWNYMRLYVSFLGWVFLTMSIQFVLMDIQVIIALVVYQFLSLFVDTYMNGAFAAFFLDVGGFSAESAGMPEQ